MLKITEVNELDVFRAKTVLQHGIANLFVRGDCDQDHYIYTTSTMTEPDGWACELVLPNNDPSYASSILNRIYSEWAKGRMEITPGHSLVYVDDSDSPTPVELARFTLVELTEEEEEAYYVRDPIDPTRVLPNVYKVVIVKDEIFNTIDLSSKSIS